LYEAVKLENSQGKNDLSLNVIISFLQLMNSEDIVKLTEQQAALTFKQVERLDILNKEGAIAPPLLADMKGQYAADQLNIVNAKAAVETAKLSLAQLMNIPYSSAMKISREGLDMEIDIYKETVDEVYTHALQQLAPVKAAELRMKAAALTVKQAAAAFYPTVSLSGQLGTNYSSAARAASVLNTVDIASGDYVVVGGSTVPVMTRLTNYRSSKIGYFNQYKNNLGTYIGIRLDIPVFKSFQTRNKVSLAKIEEKNAALVVDNSRMRLRQDIEQAYLNRSNAMEKYKIITAQLNAFDESFKAAVVRFEAGVGNSIDYISAKNNYDRAQANLLNAKYEFALRTRILDYYQGK
jgi:outer membrane protein